ncbi:MAG: RecQ family ATP-dependent DNA helicase [Solibacillus sp.]
MKLEQYLQQHFGYEGFRAGQREVIEQLVAGHDVVALLPTGMGKSLCYQLPGYLFQKPVLIVSPLLSLMQDQVDQLKQFGEKRVVALNSFLTQEEKQYALHFLHEYRFIFTSPEMLTQPQVRERLRGMELSLIVADEAHCISQWGFDFRPDYLRIAELIDTPNRPPILALSATATQSVLRDIEHYLTMNSPYCYIHSVDRANIALVKKKFAQKEQKLTWIYEHVQRTAGPGIIYTQSRARAEAISLYLVQQQIAAAAYHAGKDLHDRQFIQQQFLAGELEWIVATNAFGMGVHKGNIRQVIHESMPGNMANYMQEIGRAGRDGEPAIAYLLYADTDEQLAKFIVAEDLPRTVHIERYAYLRGHNEPPQAMLRNGEISETQFRVLHYWMQRESAEEVKSRFAQIEMKKYAAVQEMLALIESEECIRKQVLYYFGQQLTETIENCCSNCGFEEQAITQKRQLKEKQQLFSSWQNRLQQLLTKEK